jgi:uncharacterized protein (TIGR02466 family)
MVENWFAVPVYYNDINKNICEAAKEEIINAYNSLKNSNHLSNFNGTSSISFGTEIKDVISHFNMQETKNLLLQECWNYTSVLDIKCKDIKINYNWVVGYTNNQHQGLHNHGYQDNKLSGVFYVEAPTGSSPIIFSQPNPYTEHITIRSSQTQYSATVSYKAIENRVIIFPNYLNHHVPSNSELEGRRVAFVFNALVEI